MDFNQFFSNGGGLIIFGAFFVGIVAAIAIGGNVQPTPKPSSGGTRRKRNNINKSRRK